MSGLIKTGIVAHDQALAVAEGTRQAAAAAATQNPAGQVTVNNAEIAWARAGVASCLANNNGAGVFGPCCGRSEPEGFKVATSAEQTFIRGVAVAEGVRQASKASAFATYGFVLANLSAYVAALSAADVAFFTAVTAALNTAGLTGNTGQSGPIASPWASIAT
jgi:hypothetical protein